MINMNTHQSWLIASNPAKYNIFDAFDANRVITWGLTVNTGIGDIVYIYVSAPDSRMMYRCVVDRVSVPVDERLGAEYWVEPFNPNRKLVNLRLISRLNNDELRLKNLLEKTLCHLHHKVLGEYLTI